MKYSKPKHYPSVIGQSIEDLEILLMSIGEPQYRGRQLFNWIYRKKVYDLTKMTDLPKLSQEKLKAFSIHPLKILKTQREIVELSRKILKYMGAKG